MATFAPSKRGITWRQPLVFIIATAVCTVLAIKAVVLAPAGAAAGVSGLYIAAAVYVPLALWFGIWGCLAGYFSCVGLGLYLYSLGVPGYTFPFIMIWALGDFFEGFIPLVIYRSLKTKPELEFKSPELTYTINLGLAVVLVASGLSLIYSNNLAFIGTFVASILLVLVQGAVEDHKTWLTWLPIGVLLASVVSGLFGVGAMLVFNQISPADFGTNFVGWVFGDVIVLATFGTILTVVLTPYVVKYKFYVRGYFS